MTLFRLLAPLTFFASVLHANLIPSTQYITPCVVFHKHSQGSLESSAILAGVEYRIEKFEGLNTKFHLSGSQSHDTPHLHFHMEGLYKFHVSPSLTLYPVARLSYNQHGITHKSFEQETHIVKRKLNLGMGIEKQFDKLMIGMRAEVVQDLSHDVLSRNGRALSGFNDSRSIGYKFHARGRYIVSGRGNFDIEPFYGRCFNDKYVEKGCQLSYAFAF